MKLSEAVDSLKAEKTEGFDLNDKTNVELGKLQRLVEKLQSEIDGWKDEANIYHNKLTNMKTSYEAEIIKRVDAENKVQGLEETITLNNRMFKEIAETRQATTTIQSETEQNHISAMAEDYAAVFDEQLKAFEKERSTLKKKHDEKTEKLQNELKSIKEQFSKSNAELLVSQDHVKKSEQKLVETQKNHDKVEEQMRIELENEKSKNEALVLEMADLKEKMRENEEITRSQNEVSIKSELNSFESMLECEEERLGLSTRKRSAEEAPKAPSAKQAKIEVEKRKCVIM